jgi:hypothetical protein
MFPDSIKPVNSTSDLFPGSFLIGAADFVHRAAKHHAELVIGKFKNVNRSAGVWRRVRRIFSR